jgi:ubiquinone/menaquinone biosynthesis C-methylase UbiE
MQHGCRFVGADISFDMIRAGRLPSSGGGHDPALVLCDAERLPFRDRSFDYVLCVRFFNLIPPEVAFTVLVEAARVSTGGVFVQVRCRRRNPVLQMIPELKRYAARAIRGQRPVSPAQRKRFDLPAFSSFAAMVDRAGLHIRRSYRTSRMLDPDPQRVYLLEHRAAH